MLISAYSLTLCCKSRVILWKKSGITAGVPTELLCSIVLAGGDQIDEGLEDLDDLAKNVSNPDRDPM